MPTGIGEQDDEPHARPDRPQEPGGADQAECSGDGHGGADPTREIPGHRCEQPHAEHGDRPQQPYDGVRRVEIVLDLGDQRADADDLGAQRQRREEEGGERRAVRPRLDRDEVRPDALLEELQRLSEHELLDVRRLRVRLERGVVDVALPEDEGARVVGDTVHVVLQAAGLLPAERHELPQERGHTLLLAVPRHPVHGQRDGQRRFLPMASFAKCSMCLRASRPARGPSPARTASRIGTCSSAASCGSKSVP